MPKYVKMNFANGDDMTIEVKNGNMKDFFRELNMIVSYHSSLSLNVDDVVRLEVVEEPV